MITHGKVKDKQDIQYLYTKSAFDTNLESNNASGLIGAPWKQVNSLALTTGSQPNDKTCLTLQQRKFKVGFAVILLANM
jgi:hypothetical protein